MTAPRSVRGARWRVRAEPGERGAAALEFALVLPIFAFILGGLITFSGAFLAKGLLLDIANSSARACIMKVEGATQVQRCANSAVAYMLNTVHRNVCGSSTPKFDITAETFTLPGVPLQTPSLYLLRVELSCEWTDMPLMNLVANASPGHSMALSAVATMPFLSDNK